MKQKELDSVMTSLKNIKDFSDKQEYQISSFINKQINNIMPIMQNEYKRLDEDYSNTTSPKIKIVTAQDYVADNSNNMKECAVNRVVSELVNEGYKILDYNIYPQDNIKYFGYVKYILM